MVIGVRMKPGDTQFARMLRAASSCEMWRVYPRIPAFDAAYAVPPTKTDAAIDATLTIEPPPRASIRGIAARVQT